MLIPRYSLRWLLGLTTFSAGVSLVLSYAVRGHAWAIGISAGLWSLVVVAIAYVITFLAAWLVVQVVVVTRSGSRDGSGASPFAAEEFPVVTEAVIATQPTANSPPPMTG